MLHKKKILVLAPVATLLLAGSFNFKQKERNLKVLPKDISDAKLDSIMNSYNKALGVSCDFCHSKLPVLAFGSKDTLNYASDNNPMKENARDMIRLVIDINSKYFYFDKNQRPEYLHTVTCITCHQRQPIPEH